MQKWFNSPAYDQDKSHGVESYCIGSEAMIRNMPGMLLKSLDRVERYCKSWLYSQMNEKERVAAGMDRGRKTQFPCATGVTVTGSDSTPSGYHIIKTFRTTSWSPSMMRVEVIPDYKREEKS